jgi:hypothetical protein
LAIRQQVLPPARVFAERVFSEQEFLLWLLQLHRQEKRGFLDIVNQAAFACLWVP